MNLYLIRHPETTWNVESKFQGIKEGKVTNEGKKTVSKILESKLWDKMDVIYYPGSERTKYFVTQLNHKFPNKVILVDKRLNDRDFGSYEGKKFTEVSDADLFDINDYNQRYIWKPSKGETYEEVSKRVKDFTNYLKSLNYKDKNILCVTSKGTIKCILKNECNLTLKEMFNIKVDNLDVFIIYKNEYKRLSI